MSAPAFTPAPWRRIGHRTIAADRVEACGRAIDALADALRLAVPGVAP